MTRSRLGARLEKLEIKYAAKAAGFQKVVLIGVYDQNDGEIIGAGICGRHVFRLSGESLEALKARASRALGMQVLFAVYSNGLEAC